MTATMNQAITTFANQRELSPGRRITEATLSSSRSQLAMPAETLGGLFSSLLPPSFPRGRSATFFSPLRAASRGPELRFR